MSRTALGIAVEIADDGVGGAQPSAGSGLHGLQDRVEALGGHLLVTSPAGDGTVVTAELPCGSGDAWEYGHGERDSGLSRNEEDVGCPSPPSSSDPCRGP